MNQKYDKVFKHVDLNIQAFGECELSDVDFPSNGILIVDINEFQNECKARGYTAHFVNALQARFEEKSGWYFKIKK
jgi:protein associated with RNAse G/E